MTGGTAGLVAAARPPAWAQVPTAGRSARSVGGSCLARAPGPAEPGLARPGLGNPRLRIPRLAEIGPRVPARRGPRSGVRGWAYPAWTSAGATRRSFAGRARRGRARRGLPSPGRAARGGTGRADLAAAPG